MNGQAVFLPPRKIQWSWISSLVKMAKGYGYHENVYYQMLVYHILRPTLNHTCSQKVVLSAVNIDTHTD